MPKSKEFSLHFPLGGLDRRRGYQNQAPYTSVDMENVRGDDVGAGRARGGQRPGVVKAYEQELGSGAPVVMMGQVATADDTAQLYYSDSFDRTDDDLGTGWDAATWIGDQPGVTTSLGSLTANGYLTGAVLSSQNLDATAEYDIKLQIVPDYQGTTLEHHGEYHIYARMDDTTPDVTTDGIDVKLTLSGTTGAYDGNIIHYASSVATTYAFSVSGNKGGVSIATMRVNIVTDTIKVYWGETLLITQAVAAATGSKLGFGMLPSAAGELCLVGNFSLTGTPGTATPSQNRRTYLVAVSGGQLYAEQTAGLMEAVAGATGFSTTHSFACAERAQKLYIADHKTDGSGVISVYDPKLNTHADLSPTAGSIPTNCDTICVYRDRLVTTKGHLWYMSRSGSPTDWDYSVLDALGAVAGQNSDAGIIGENIRAAYPYNDDVLIFGCSNSVYALRGDPRAGGRIDTLSLGVGIVDKFAACYGPSAELFFLSNDGLYVISPNASSRPESLSREKLPQELVRVDVVNNTVNLCHNQIERGVNIFITPNEGGDVQSWFYDLEFKAFYPDSFTRAHHAWRTFDYKNEYPTLSGMLVGCNDGYIRQFDPAATTDDGTNITSYVDIGPILLADSNHREGLLNEVNGVLAEDSGDVTWGVYVGRTAERLDSVSAFDTGTWDGSIDGPQYTVRPRARGGSAKLRLTSSGTFSWGMEYVFCTKQVKGKHRVV